jgi:N-acetylneuraminate lyase
MKSFEGVLPALVTPLREDGSLNGEALEALLARCYSCGVDGVYACGQSGEGLQLPPALRRQVCEIVVRNSPRETLVVVHVGAASTADAVALAKHAARTGAAAVSSLPPGGSYGFEEIKAYYRDLAAAAGVPALLYYFPEFGPAIQTLEQLLELCALPGVAGLKFTDFDLYRLAELRRAGHAVFNGRDEVFAAGLLMGANGGIGSFYNLAPATFVAIRQCACRGDWAEARRLQLRVNELIRLTLRYPALSAIKRLLASSGIDAGLCVKPRRELTSEECSGLHQDLAAAGFIPDHFARGAVE